MRLDGIKQKTELVTRNTAEFLTRGELEEKLSGKKSLSVYYGRAITGPLHMGHLISLSKLLDLQHAGFSTIILLADIHAALDDLKCRWEDLDIRKEYSRKALELSMEWKVKPKMVVGSDYQLGKDYQMDIFKMSTVSTVSAATHAASEVTRMKNPKVSELIYPIMQALDEQYLGVDMQLGGLDQRHILTFAREYLPKIGYEKRMEIMMPLLTSMKGPGVKMSSSVPGSYLKVNASEKEIRSVINGAYCPEGVANQNPIVEIVSMFALPSDGKFFIGRDAKYGGDVEITSSEQLKEMFTKKSLHPADLKKAVADYLVARFQKTRDYFEGNRDLLKRLGPNFE